MEISIDISDLKCIHNIEFNIHLNINNFTYHEFSNLFEKYFSIHFDIKEDIMNNSLVTKNYSYRLKFLDLLFLIVVIFFNKHPCLFYGMDHLRAIKKALIMGLFIGAFIR